MRGSASEKLERIRLVEGSSLSIRRTLTEIGLPHSTFSAWYKRYLEGGPEALEDRKPRLWSSKRDFQFIAGLPREAQIVRMATLKRRGSGAADPSQFHGWPLSAAAWRLAKVV